MSRILVGYDGSTAPRVHSIARVVEARDRHMRTAVVSVASMPLDLDAPRSYGTLDDISPDEGRPLSPPPEIVAHLEEAREILAVASVDSELTSAPVSRATGSSRWRGASDPLCPVPPSNGGALRSATCVLRGAARRWESKRCQARERESVGGFASSLNPLAAGTGRAGRSNCSRELFLPRARHPGRYAASSPPVGIEPPSELWGLRSL